MKDCGGGGGPGFIVIGAMCCSGTIEYEDGAGCELLYGSGGGVSYSDGPACILMWRCEMVSMRWSAW